MTEQPHDHPSPRPARAVPLRTIQRTARMFRAAGEPSRLRLLALLADGERCVGELVGEDDTMSAISQRLRVLRNAGLVHGRRDGKHIYYSLADAHVEELLMSALEHGDEDHDHE